MSNRKRKSWFILIASMCFAFLSASCGGGGGGSASVSNPNTTVVPPADEPEEDAFASILHTTWARIDGVTYPPISPNNNPRITVRVTPMGDENEETPVTRTAKLIYRVNGSQEQEVPLTIITTYFGSLYFEGNIPEQPSGSTVEFYIRVQDSFGNVTTGAFPSTPDSILWVSGYPDVDNSADIVPDNLDLITMSAGYDNDYFYIKYSVQGEITGGTIDPPYVHIYGAKFTNPDIEQSEGLMVGKLWFNMPIMTEPDGQRLLSEMLGQSGYPDGVDQEDFDEAMQSGQMLVDLQKLMSGNFVDGMMFDADPQGTAAGGVFTGRVRRDAFGDMPSGYIRIVTLTAANASIGSFMPIPVNCSHFLTLKTEYYGYVVP